MGISNRPFWRCDGHAFDTLDVLRCEVGIVDDEPLEDLPPDVYGGRQRDVDAGRAHIGQLVNRQRRLVGN